MDTMLRRALREYAGLRHQLDRNLLGNEGEVWQEQLKKFLRKEACWVPGAQNLSRAKLEYLGGMAFLKRDTWFVAKKELGYAKVFGLKLNISRGFEDMFLNCPGKIENASNGSSLYYLRVQETTTTRDVLTDLGGWIDAEVSLAEIYALLQKQPNGELGMLHPDGNTFFVSDQKNQPAVVSIFWSDNAWTLYAHEAPGFSGVSEGSRVFCRRAPRAY